MPHGFRERRRTVKTLKAVKMRAYTKRKTMPCDADDDDDDADVDDIHDDDDDDDDNYATGVDKMKTGAENNGSRGRRRHYVLPRQTAP